MSARPDAAAAVGRRVWFSRKKRGERAEVDFTHLGRMEAGDGNPTLHKLL